MTAATEWEHDVHRRLIGGDQDALGECYDQFSSFVYGLSQRVIGDRRAAEDITQDVFLYLWERADAFDPDRGGLRTWLGTLAHRRSVDYVRREEARRRRTCGRISEESPRCALPKSSGSGQAGSCAIWMERSWENYPRTWVGLEERTALPSPMRGTFMWASSAAECRSSSSNRRGAGFQPACHFPDVQRHARSKAVMAARKAAPRVQYALFAPRIATQHAPEIRDFLQVP